MKTVDVFWSSLGSQLWIDAPRYPELQEIKSAEDFGRAFEKSNRNNDLVIFIDEFDDLLSGNNDVKDSFMKTVYDIKKAETSAIRSVVVIISPFSILYLNTKEPDISPFEIEGFQSPNLILEEVQLLYKEYADENNLIIDPKIIEDIYMRTNGYVKLVGKLCEIKLIISLHDSGISFARIIDDHLIGKLVTIGGSVSQSGKTSLLGLL